MCIEEAGHAKEHSITHILAQPFNTLTQTAIEHDVIVAMQTVVDRLRLEKGPLRILEAGCGSASVISFPGDRITGIDLSDSQLARNTVLHESICGDICTHEFGDREFDVVICWNVLEHVDDPKAAFVNLSRALASDGVMLLALPNRNSLHGLVVRMTPHWFHVFVVRYLLGKSWAGRNGCGPFRTTMRKSAEFGAICSHARASDLEISLALKYEGSQQRRLAKRLWPLKWALKMLRVMQRNDATLSAMAFLLTNAKCSSSTK